MKNPLHQEPAPANPPRPSGEPPHPAHPVSGPRRLASVLLTPVLLATVLLAAGLLATGCQNEPEVAESGISTADAADLSPEELGRLGARLSQEPGRAEAILAEEGVTWESFQAAVREVAASVETARRYSEAYRDAGGGGDATAPSAPEPTGG
ncbi:MAG TPA: hypothetical protein VHQ65_07810 [Thermoanaerobaculia bacterium]|nr:hypothetical protein [Thermoanaerobaculia bacterium]